MKVKESSKESPQVQNKRNKLKKQIEAERVIITSQAAIEKAKESNQQWILRHAAERQPLEKRNIEKQPPAAPKSTFVRKLFTKLNQESAKPPKKINAQWEGHQE